MADVRHDRTCQIAERGSCTPTAARGKGATVTQLLAAAISALVAGVVAFVVARTNARSALVAQEQRLRTELDNTLAAQQHRLETELRTEFMAEEALRRLLLETRPLRTFTAIKRRVRGFEDDELRQLLVRAGALCYERRRDKAELWGLRERTEEKRRQDADEVTPDDELD